MLRRSPSLKSKLSDSGPSVPRLPEGGQAAASLGPAQPTEAHRVQAALKAQPCCHLTNLSPLPFTVLFFFASSSFCSPNTSPHSKVIKCTGSAVIRPPQSIYGSGPQPLWKFPEWEAGD